MILAQYFLECSTIVSENKIGYVTVGSERVKVVQNIVRLCYDRVTVGLGQSAIELGQDRTYQHSICWTVNNHTID